MCGRRHGANVERMTLTDSSRGRTSTAPRLDRAGCLYLVVGGIAFFAYGPLHPKGSNQGNRDDQLHSMLIDPLWYPAHAVGVLAFACVAAGLIALRGDPVLRDRLGRLLPVAVAVALVAVVGSVVHLLSATQATAIHEGRTTPLVAAFVWAETLVNPAWAVMIAALAVVGGVTRTLGNRLLLPLGLAGGVAFAIATATIAFVDTFDPLFPVAGLTGVWLVAAGVVGLTRWGVSPG